MITVAELKVQDARRRVVLEWFVAKKFVGDTYTTVMHAANAVGDCNAQDFTDMIALGLLSKDRFNLTSNPLNGYTSITDAGLEVLGIDPEEYHAEAIRQAEEDLDREIAELEDELDELEDQRRSLEIRRDRLQEQRGAATTPSAPGDGA